MSAMGQYRTSARLLNYRNRRRSAAQDEIARDDENHPGEETDEGESAGDGGARDPGMGAKQRRIKYDALKRQRESSEAVRRDGPMRCVPSAPIVR